MRTRKLLSLLIVMPILILSCAGCGRGAPSTTSTAQPTAASQSLPTATSAPLPEATEQASKGQQAIQRAQAALGRQLDVAPSAIAIVSEEAVEWPDTCLGVHVSGLMCAMHVVPGYRIVLEVSGQRYGYHANEDGSALAAVPNLRITWEDGDQCQKAELDHDQGVTYGPCDGAETTVPLADNAQAPDLASFAGTYASFTAETAVGSVQFFGTGDKIAVASEQRMIAEWARLAVEEAIGGRVGAAYGLALAWHREGGIAGFCDDLAVYVTGEIDATSCKGTEPKNLGRHWMDAEQLQHLYAWVDTLKSFEVHRTDKATADAMAIHLLFTGHGQKDATDADKQTIEAFASQLFVQASRGGIVPGATQMPAASSDPAGVVSALFSSIQDDPSGNSGLVYLSQSLQCESHSTELCPDATRGGVADQHSSSLFCAVDGRFA